MTINIIDNEKQPITLTHINETWYKLKTKFSDAIVLIRSGDDYFSFEEDAAVVVGLMQAEPLPLWKERQLCTLPYHDTDEFLSKAVKAGYRVALCEPLFFSPQK